MDILKEYEGMQNRDKGVKEEHDNMCKKINQFQLSPKHNESGIQPIEYKVLVLPDVVTDETVGGILKPGRLKDIEQAAAVRGYLVAVGGKAFEDFGEPTPWIGVRVQYAKYSGVHEVPGADGKSYILCNDKDIAAIINKEELLITRDGNYRFKPEKATYEREEIENG